MLLAFGLLLYPSPPSSRCIPLTCDLAVCNQGTGFECNGCEPELICNDIGVDMGACCDNFEQVTEFSKSLINELTSIPGAEQSYSLVGFSTEATLAADMATPADTVAALDQLVYVGGRTNHAAAINSCRASLPTPTSTRKNIMVMITDGDPSEPQGSPQVDAEAAAARAKADGIFIIPVMIIPEFTTIIPDPVKYLQKVSSDGTVFDVSDFESFTVIQDSLIAQVSCQV